MKHITANLAPGAVPNFGSGLDLPIALGVLMASGQLPSDCDLGGLGLDDSVRSVAERLLAACDDGPTSTDEPSARSGLAVTEVLATVSRLLESGRLVADGARVRPSDRASGEGPPSIDRGELG